MSADEGDDDDGTQRLESTTPGIMLHELTHRLLNTQGVLDTIVDGDGNPGRKSALHIVTIRVVRAD